MKGACTDLVLSLQFGIEMNWLYFSIELSVNLCDSCIVHHRLDVIDVLADCFHTINSNCDEILAVIGTVRYQS
jgi:hypothetical protein